MTMKYCNPVYPHDFADPFVLKTGDLYYAFGTSAPVLTDDRFLSCGQPIWSIGYRWAVH